MRAEAHKFVEEFSLELVFPNPGLEEAQHAVVAGGGDVGSHLHGFHFFGVLDGAQGHKCRRRPLVFLVGESAAQVGSKAVLAGFHGIVAANVFVAKQVGMLGMSHNLAQDAIKVAQPVNTLDSAQGTRLVFGELGTLPAGDEVVGFYQKKHLALLGLGRIRKEYENGFLLVHPAQPEDVGGLLEGEAAVGRSGVNVAGVKKSDGIRL